MGLSKKTPPKNGTGARVRIKQKYTEYIEALSDERDEDFIDTLYFIIDSHRQNALSKAKSKSK